MKNRTERKAVRREKKLARKNFKANPAYEHNIAARAGRWSATHPKTAIVGWFVFVALALVIGGQVGQKNIENFENYSGESAKAELAMHEHLDEEPAQETLVVHSKNSTYGTPAFDQAVKQVAEQVSKQKDVENVVSPYTRAGPEGYVSEDGHTVRVAFAIKGDPEKAVDKVDPILASVKKADAANETVTVKQIGDASADKEIDEMISGDLEKARNLSVPITLLILMFAFGALVAAGIPVILALTSVMATMGLIALPSQLSPMDPAVGEVVVLVGMAVGVDYSLFYLKREREERAAGRGDLAAIEAAAATSGRAVLISGFTVIAAMSGMLLAGDKVFISFGIGTMMVVAIAMIGSLTVLPALLSALGTKVDRGRIPFISKRRERRAASGQANGAWARIVDVVLRRPLVSAVLATALLLALAYPALQMKTQDMSIKDMPQDLAVLQAYNSLEKAFPSQGASAEVVYQNSDVRSAESKAAIADLSAQAVETGKFLEPIEFDYSKDGKLVAFDVPIVGGDDNDVAIAATRVLRDDVIPDSLETVPGATVYTTGDAASSLDFTENLKDRAPLVFGFVLSLAFLLLLVTFRSIVVPIKAIILNLLSVAAAYGVLVLVFQHGWGESLLGFESNGAIWPFLPLFLFVILFGLSMDYHVFIISRIRELWDAGESSEDAVRDGIRSTAGVVTSAAIVMVAVFGIFAGLGFLPMKQMGVGLAAAILIDATIIRAVLLPATMKLLGDANWYLPRWLEWLPQIHRESTPPATTEGSPEIAGARA